MLLFFVFTGCGLNSWGNLRSNLQSTVKATDTDTPQVRKKLVFWHIQLVGSISDVVKHSVERFMKDNPDVEVEIVLYLNEAYKLKLVVAMETRNPPDIFPTWGGGPLFEYAKAGQVLDITEMFDTEGYRDRFLKHAVESVTFDGKVWAVPVEGCVIAVIFYNKKIFEELGLKVPQTYSQLLDIVKKLRSKGIIPFALANRTKWPGSMFYMYFVDRLGGPRVFEKAASRNGGSFEDETFVKAGEMVQDLVKLGAFPDGFNGLDYDTMQSRSLMYSGKAAMELTGTWNIGNVRDENDEFYKNCLDFFPFPEIEGGKGDTADLIGTFGDNFYSISKSCKYPKEAFKLIQTLIDDTAVEERAAKGRIPPVKSFKTTDPMLRRVLKLISEAPSVQLWYDQYLPLELGEKHKNICQAIFDLSISPREAAKQMEEAARKYYRTGR